MIGKTAKIHTADKDNGRVGTIERVWPDGAASIYIQGDDDVKVFEFYEYSVERGATHDFSSSGFGIGGAGSHGLLGEQLDMIATGEMQLREHKCGWSHGSRYDEECANCGRVTMICNECELCERCHP